MALPFLDGGDELAAELRDGDTSFFKVNVRHEA